MVTKWMIERSKRLCGFRQQQIKNVWSMTLGEINIITRVHVIATYSWIWLTLIHETKKAWTTLYRPRESKKRLCIVRESNPGRPRGRRAFYHWTNDAKILNQLTLWFYKSRSMKWTLTFGMCQIKQAQIRSTDL